MEAGKAMAAARSNDWGWVFLRVAAGLIFLGMGLKAWESGGADLKAIAQIVAGVTAIIGIFVRPGALCVLAAATWLTVSARGARISFNEIVPLLCACGLLIGGGGSVLAVGYMIAGLRGRWWQ